MSEMTFLEMAAVLLYGIVFFFGSLRFWDWECACYGSVLFYLAISRIDVDVFNFWDLFALLYFLCACG